MTAPAPAPARPSASVRRFVWHNVPSPLDTSAPAGLTGRLVAVVGLPGRVREAVSAELVGHGAKLWNHGDPGVPDAIVDLTLTEPFAPGAPRAADEALVRTLAVLRHCYEDWAAETDTRRLAYLAVTYLDGRSGYSGHAVHQPWGGIWAGLAKSLHRELPVVSGKVVDVDDPDLSTLPSIIAAELYQGGPAEIGYRDGTRHVLLPRSHPAPVPTLTLDSEDVVLVCGGGTGIGFELARALARSHGCRVVIAGRATPPEGTEPWLDLDADAFDGYRRDLIRDAAGTGGIRDIRRRIGKLGHLRELDANLRAVHTEGLPLRYLACDVSDPAQAAALIDGLAAELTGVVYLAGVDRPARLPSKSDADFLTGVAVKTTGFLRVLDAVRQRDLKLKFFCNSGSLTGRLGGMVGELDYSAANEALARLGLWARAATGLNVLTVCWPLWRGLSVSTNVGAALKYMPAMDPAEGFGNWCAELTSPKHGEVVYLGPITGGMDLTKAGQFPLDPALPGFRATLPAVFHRGAPTEWKPGEHLRSGIRFTSLSTPATHDFHVDGTPALPVSLLLETALRSCHWLTPQLPSELTDVEIHPEALRLTGGSLDLLRETTATGSGTFAVAIRTAGGLPVATMTVGTREIDPTPPPPEPVSLTEEVSGEAVSVLRWKGALIPLAAWRRHACGTLTAPVRPCAPADLWTAEPAPASLLPVAALENILRVACTGGPLRIERVAVHPEHRHPTRVVGEPRGRHWYALDDDSRVALALTRP